jgi:uncharacterized membrane protein YgaE (UPF0421/DUF939 family)
MAGGGWLLAQERFKERTRQLRTEVDALSKELSHSVAKIEQRLDSLPQGFKLEIGTHRGDIDDSIEELKEKLEKLTDKIDRTRDSSSDFAKEAELAKLVFEVNARFETIMRAIGTLEGSIFNERGRRDR